MGWGQGFKGMRMEMGLESGLEQVKSELEWMVSEDLWLKLLDKSGCVPSSTMENNPELHLA